MGSSSERNSSKHWIRNPCCMYSAYLIVVGFSWSRFVLSSSSSAHRACDRFALICSFPIPRVPNVLFMLVAS